MKALLATITLLLLSFFCSIPVVGQQVTPVRGWSIRGAAGLFPTFLRDRVDTEQLPLSLELRFQPSVKFSLGILYGQSVATAKQLHHSGASRTVRNQFQLYGIRAAAHRKPFKKVGYYGGMLLGYGRSKLHYLSDFDPKLIGNNPFPKPPVRNSLFFSAFIGGEFDLSPRFSCFGEFGFGLSLVNFGCTVRLNK